MFTCDHCKISIDDSRQKFCPNCGRPVAAATIPGNRSLPACAAGSSADCEPADVALWLSLSPLCAGRPQVIPCKLRNDAGVAITGVHIHARLWGMTETIERTFCQTLPPGVECLLGIPLAAHGEGHCLITSLRLDLTLAGGSVRRWQTRDELRLTVNAPGQAAPTIYHVTMQDYAQLFGNIQLADGFDCWQQLSLVAADDDTQRLPAEAMSANYQTLAAASPCACLLIDDGVAVHRCYLAADNSAWFGRSGKAAFPVADEILLVSGLHARIYADDASWYIEDRSKNGTHVNACELRAGQRYPLRDGDIVALAPSFTLLTHVYANGNNEFALRLSCRERPLTYLAFCQPIMLGGSLACALPMSEFKGMEIASLAFMAGYRLHFFVPFRVGQENGFPGQTVLLKSGVSLRVGRTTLQFEQ